MKRILILCNILFALFCATACSNTSDITDQIANVVQSEDEHVLSVKNGTNSNYPGKTYGEAFDSYFDSPAWKYFKGIKEGTDEDGDGKPDSEEEDVDVVEFTGYCLYQDVRVKALIQFTLNDDDTFSATFLSFNDVPQNMFMLVDVIENVFTDGEGTTTAEVSTEKTEIEVSDDEKQDTTGITSEEAEADTEWYRTNSFFYNSETEIFLEVSYYDDGSLDFIFDGTSAFSYFGDDSFVENGIIYYNCNDGTQIQYFIDAAPCIRVVGHDDYNGYYYLY